MATCYSLHLQRVHNAKSVKPLGQIDTGDFKNLMYVYIQNNGLGPMLIDKLTFTKNGRQFDSISECLNLDPESYWHIRIDESIQKVVLPNTHFKVFEKNITDDTAVEAEDIRQQLSSIILKVHCRDIYDNKFCLERHLDWFVRHRVDEKNKSM